MTRQGPRFECSTGRPLRRMVGIAVISFGLSTVGWAEKPSHPLDGLTEQEHWTIYDVIKTSDNVPKNARFIRVLLREPPKQEVLGWDGNQAIRREAELVLRSEGRTFEAVVDITSKELKSWKEVMGVHAGEVWDDLLAPLQEAVEKHPKWQAAIKKRGITDPSVILVGPISPAFTDVSAGDTRRLMKLVAFDRHGTFNIFGRPIAGLVAIVDVDKKDVLAVLDTGPISIPKGPVDYDEGSVGELREAPAPLTMSQPRGPGFKVHGHEVNWQNWQFHFRIDPRVGPVISQVRYVDGGKVRSVLYQGHLSELFVPYMDPSMDWRDRAYLDLAENAGGIAVPLQSGVDCPDYATLFDTVVADVQGIPKRVPQAACLFELDPGSMAWRHQNLLNNLTEGRRSRVLVLRMIATLGNYDYVFDWIFQQNGAIRVRVGSTGIDQVKAVANKDLSSGESDAAYGRFVAPHTVAVNHDHYFCFRLDLDVDGIQNSFLREGLKVIQSPSGHGRKIWVVDPVVASTEREARMRMNLSKPALWRIINPAIMGAVGNPVSYHIRPLGTGQSLLSEADYPAQRGGFTKYHLWVTPLRKNERYADGKYPFRNGPDGLAYWSDQNRNIKETDIVAWYTMGFHHVPSSEDWPVYNVGWHSVTLAPYNFFDHNPAIDLPE